MNCELPDPLLVLKVSNIFHEKVPLGLFLMTRNCDAKTCMYTANRKENRLVKGNEVHCAWTTYPEFKQEASVTDVLYKNFFGLQAKQIEDSSRYEARLAGFPNRPMILRLGKKISVTPMATFLVGPETISVPEVDVIDLHMNMNFDALGVPDLLSVVAYGIVRADRVPVTAKPYCTPVPNTEFVIVYEKIAITDEMRTRFDVTDLAKQWFKEATGGGTSL